MSIINKKDEFRELAAFTVLFYLIPILMLSFGYIPFEARHIVLFVMGLVLMAYAISKGIKAKELGFRRDNLKVALLKNLLYSMILVLLMYIFWQVGFLESVHYEGTFLFLVFYILVSVPIQEFIFRSLMIYEIKIFTDNKYALIGISSVMFSLMHVMYHSWQILVITLIAGIIWGITYLKWPNFWGVVLSHIIVGVAAVFVGII